MKNFLFAVLITLISMLAFNACYYDVESQLYPAGGTTCDTTNVTYSITIRSILQNNNCLTCHSGTGAAGNNIVLDSYTSVKTYAQNGKLYGSINQDPGFVAMPQGGTKISVCDLNRVRIWINSGIQNN
jgi:hypothetical protein